MADIISASTLLPVAWRVKLPATNTFIPIKDSDVIYWLASWKPKIASSPLALIKEIRIKRSQLRQYYQDGLHCEWFPHPDKENQILCAQKILTEQAIPRFRPKLCTFYRRMGQTQLFGARPSINFQGRIVIDLVSLEFITS